MKAIHNWHLTPLGRATRFLGSINLAVPVLVFVAAALAWGTYLESAHNVKIARATVYGSWWFMGLMGLMCVSLIFAVITRFPWKRKHVGFMTVHAGLIILIVGGFWSLFGRIEGQLPIEAGNQSNILTTDTEQVELLRHQNGDMEPVQTATLENQPIPIPGLTRTGPQRITLGSTTLEVLGRWDNTKEEAYVTDDATSPLRAVELTIDNPPMMEDETIWIGEESHGAAPVVEKDIRVRVLPPGQPFVPTTTALSGYIFASDIKEVALPAEGSEVIPGWKVESIRRFGHAMVTGTGLEEAKGGADNPAVEVTITDGTTREQHRAFLNFPDMLMSKAIAGEAKSNLKLIARAAQTSAETLVFHGTPPALTVSYTGPDSKTQDFTSPGTFPWIIQPGHHTIKVLNQFTHAKPNSRLAEAPKTSESRPALIVRLVGAPEDDFIPLVWRQLTPLPIPVAEGQDPIMVRFGPRLVTLPFTIKLNEFRKKDYSGTEMAMSYESDVAVTLGGQTDSHTISMNEPFKGAGWKVYQSGFMGNDVSVFSIMKDPGLPLTYIGCITLCIGIALTFYSRALSTGHPGIPALFGARKENGNVPNPVAALSAPRAPAERPCPEPEPEPELVGAN